MRGAGLDPEVIVSGVDETSVVGPSDVVAGTLAVRKAQLVAQPIEDHALVLGCDTVLDLDGVPLGKPATPDEAVERWERLRGRTGEVLTGHCLVSTPSQQHVTAVARTRVSFGRPSDEEVRAYVASGEPQQVAGAFTIDRLGGWFIERIDGDHSNVIGLSLPTLRSLLGQVGVSVPALWSLDPQVQRNP